MNREPLHIGVAGPVSLPIALPGMNPDSLPASYPSPIVAAIVRSLLERGHRVSVFTTSPGADSPMEFREGSLTVYVVPRRQRGIVRDVYSAERRALVDAMQRARPDVIEAQWTYEFAWAAIKSGIPTAVMIRDNARRVFELEPDLFRFVRLLMDLRTRLMARHLVANSDYTARLSGRGVIAVIENPLSPTLNVAEGETRRAFDRPYMVTVVNGFSALKNLEAGLRAFALIRRERPDLDYVMVGRDTEPGGKVERWATLNGLSHGVRFEGPHDAIEAARWIRDAEVLLHPSLEESFGNAVVEAMCLSTPVVGGANSGNVPYVLKGGEYGVLTDVTEPESIAAAVLELLGDSPRRERMVRNARAAVRERYDAARIGELHERLLYSVLEGGRPMRYGGLYGTAVLGRIARVLLAAWTRLANPWRLGRGARLFGRPIVTAAPDSTITVGDDCTLISLPRYTALGVSRPCVIRTLCPGARLVIGDGVGMSGAAICAAESVTVGNRVLMGAGVTIIDTDFHETEVAVGSRREPSERAASAPVVIGDDVFLGAGVIVLKGVSIGERATVGAGSVVTKDIPAGMTAVGVPCRLIEVNKG